MKTIATHNGAFHADEVFAVAILQLVFATDTKVIRTRDEALIGSADIVVDVGGIYDEVKDRFDHHQKDGSGKRENNIPYASFGLVWKKYGLTLCGNTMIVDEIDREIVQPIDAEDNGIELSRHYKSDVHPFSVSSVVHVFNSTWKETERNRDEAFMECLDLAKKILNRMIVRSRDKHEADKFVLSAYEEAEDKRLIILDNMYPAREILSKYSEPLFIIRYRSDENRWALETMRIDSKGFKNRKDLPKKWAGKSGLEFQKVSGVKDAIFCHRGLFLAIAESKEGVLELAKKALENN